MIVSRRMRRLALVLAVCALPMVAFAGNEPRPDPFAGSTAHPWKIALARRLADEGMESREARQKLAEQALREWKKKQREAGRRARPATPDGSTPHAAGDAKPPRKFGATTFSLVFRAAPGREAVLLRIASAYEAASKRRIPPPAFGALQIE